MAGHWWGRASFLFKLKGSFLNFFKIFLWYVLKLHIFTYIFYDNNPSTILYLEVEGSVTDRVAQAPCSSWKKASWCLLNFFYNAFLSYTYLLVFLTKHTPPPFYISIWRGGSLMGSRRILVGVARKIPDFFQNFSMMRFKVTHICMYFLRKPPLRNFIRRVEMAGHRLSSAGFCLTWKEASWFLSKFFYDAF